MNMMILEEMNGKMGEFSGMIVSLYLVGGL